MINETTAQKPLVLRILQYPLTRLFLLGPLLFVLMGISNGLWSVQFSDRPWIAIAMATLMAAFALLVYAASVRFIEQRLSANWPSPPWVENWGSVCLPAPVFIRFAC